MFQNETLFETLHYRTKESAFPYSTVEGVFLLSTPLTTETLHFRTFEVFYSIAVFEFHSCDEYSQPNYIHHKSVNQSPWKVLLLTPSTTQARKDNVRCTFHARISLANETSY